MAKSQKKEAAAATLADQVAEFIGKTMGELLNRKDALAKQMAEVDSQISEVGKRVSKQFGAYLPATTRRARVKKAVSKKTRVAKRAVREISEETRAKMAEAARKRWAKTRGKKA
ncbi:MAG: hypothetical protein IT177_13080 [Acidobacteria bacterium]|nr:hypothetical protein [Acidobacteriota bacterium]